MRIYICADFSRECIEELLALGHEVRTGGWGFTHDILDEDRLIAEIGDAEILIVGYEPVTPKVLDNCNLKLIFSIRGGPRANIDVDYATQKGIPVFQTFGREAVPVSDFAMGQLLSLVRHITRTDRELRRGMFIAPDKKYGSEKDDINIYRKEFMWCRFSWCRIRVESYECIIVHGQHQ
jgi:phosphoglycerate dehydrogenase-like enzyme